MSVPIPAELVRAALPFAVLLQLRRGRLHGYALIEALESAGFTKIQGGTLYPMLRRMEERGQVAHEWVHGEAGPGRKMIGLTAAGEAELETLQTAWAALNTHLDRLREGAHGDV